MKFSIYSLLLAGLSLGTAQAQTISFGPRLGVNLGTGNFTDFNNLGSALGGGPGAGALPYTQSHGYQVGLQLGAVLNVAWGPWAFQPALLFSQKGLTQTLDASAAIPGYFSYQLRYEKNCRIHYLELPLNMVRSFSDDGQGFQVFAGPYLALGVGGRGNFRATLDYTDPSLGPQHLDESRNVPVKFGNTQPDLQGQTDPVAQVRQFDAGFNAGIGYRRGPVQAQLGYGLGVVNVYPDYAVGSGQSNDTGYLRTVQLTATYFLDHWPAARK